MSRGFTLIDLLIVSAVIGIIVGIAIPSLQLADAIQNWPVKRVATAETVYSPATGHSTEYTAADGSTCSLLIADETLVGKLLKCDWKTAEATR